MIENKKKLNEISIYHSQIKFKSLLPTAQFKKRPKIVLKSTMNEPLILKLILTLKN